MACGLAAALISLDSCTSARAPKAVARTLEEAQYNQVYSFNDQLAPKAREFSACGALPERTHRALVQWLKESEVRPYSYARPQYFIELSKNGATVASPNKGRTPKTTCWALCTDGRGNLTGVLASSGKDARTLPTVGNYNLYVCATRNKAALNEAIMASLEPYDAFRVSYRTTKGLRTLSKPAVASQPKVITTPAKKAEAKLGNTTDEEETNDTSSDEDTDSEETDDAADTDTNDAEGDADFEI